MPHLRWAIVSLVYGWASSKQRTRIIITKTQIDLAFENRNVTTSGRKNEKVGLYQTIVGMGALWPGKILPTVGKPVLGSQFPGIYLGQRKGSDLQLILT